MSLEAARRSAQHRQRPRGHLPSAPPWLGPPGALYLPVCAAGFRVRSRLSRPGASARKPGVPAPHQHGKGRHGHQTLRRRMLSTGGHRVPIPDPPAAPKPQDGACPPRVQMRPRAHCFPCQTMDSTNLPTGGARHGCPHAEQSQHTWLPRGPLVVEEGIGPKS